MSHDRHREVDQAAVAAVLDGARHYDDLHEVDQAAVRAAWDQRIAARIGSLDMVAEFRAEGLAWAEAAEDGAPILRR